MEDVTQAALGLLAAVLTALASIMIRAATTWVEVLRQRAMLLVQERLGQGAARAAGDVVSQLVGDPSVTRATQEMVDTAASALALKFQDTLQAHKIPTTAIRDMVLGELGKMGVRVGR